MENTSDSAFYKTIVETSNEGVWVVDVNYVTQFVNPKMASILGYDRDQIIGKKLTDFLPAHTTFDPNHHFQSEKAEILEIEFINSAKKSIFVRLNASPFFKDGTLVNITAMVCDITEKRISEAKDHENLQHYLSLFEDSPVPIWDEDFSKIKQAIDELKASGIKDIHTYLSQNTPELIRLAELLIVNKINHAVVELNEAISKDQVLSNFKHLTTDNSFDYILLQMDAIANGKTECQFDAELVTLKGNKRHIHFRWKVVKGYETTYEKVFLTTTDFTDRIKEENLVLQQSNREKETLLKEIHHRVKNNLQIISSLLRLQAHTIDDETVKSIFDVSLNRISSMATVHEMLYRSSEYSKIDYKEYLHTLINSLIDTISDQQSIQFQIEVEDVVFTIETAVPLGLLMNEILTNSIKHAFKSGENGIIYIRIKATKDDHFILEIGDNGSGIQQTDDDKKNETLGLSLIDSLAEQLGAKLDVNTATPGTHYVMHFSPE